MHIKTENPPMRVYSTNKMSFNLCQIDALTCGECITEIPAYDARRIKKYLLDLIWASEHFAKKVYAKLISE